MTLEQPAWISALICLPMWDRITCLLWTFYSFTCRLGNGRAFYKMLYGTASPGECDKVLILEIFSAIFLVGISLIDMHNWGQAHLFVSVTFFVISTYETLYFAFLMNKYKSKIDPSLGSFITRVTALSWITLGSGLLLMYGKFYMKEPNPVGVYFEWITVFLFINYYMVVNV